jgi:hypothetical protein
LLLAPPAPSHLRPRTKAQVCRASLSTLFACETTAKEPTTPGCSSMFVRTASSHAPHVSVAPQRRRQAPQGAPSVRFILLRCSKSLILRGTRAIVQCKMALPFHLWIQARFATHVPTKRREWSHALAICRDPLIGAPTWLRDRSCSSFDGVAASFIATGSLALLLNCTRITECGSASSA